MHLDDEQIQRLLHGELVGAVGEAARGHMSGCPACQTRLDEARREDAGIHTLLQRLDHAAPKVEIDSLVARATRGASAPRWPRWAAGIVLAVALAGAAYAAPGSPLPRWVRGVVRLFTAPGTSSAEPSAAGIAIQPGARFTVEFHDSTGGQVTVWLTDRSEVAVRSLDSTATFTTDVDRLIVENPRPGADYEIELPNGAPWVEIRAGGRRLLLKEGPSMIAGVQPDEGGRYVLVLTAEPDSGRRLPVR